MHPGSSEGVATLSEAECTRRLAGAVTGFLATTERALPMIVPVSITAVGDRLLLSPLLGASMPGRAAGGTERAVVALAVGNLGTATAPSGDGSDGDAWAVVVQGVLDTTPCPSHPGTCSLQAELLGGWWHRPERIGG